MRRIRFRYPVVTELELTSEELDRLIEGSRRHYDRACRNMTEPGGLLYGWRNKMLVYERVSPDEKPVFFVGTDDLDLLVKCCEVGLSGPEGALFVTLKTLLTEAIAEWQRVNEEDDPCGERECPCEDIGGCDGPPEEPK